MLGKFEGFPSNEELELVTESVTESHESFEADIERETESLRHNLEEYTQLSASFEEDIDALPEEERKSRWEIIHDTYNSTKNKLNVAMAATLIGGNLSLPIAMAVYEQNPDLYRQTAENITTVGIGGSIATLSVLALGHGYNKMRRALQERGYYGGQE